MKLESLWIGKYYVLLKHSLYIIKLLVWWRFIASHYNMSSIISSISFEIIEIIRNIFNYFVQILEICTNLFIQILEFCNQINRKSSNIIDVTILQPVTIDCDEEIHFSYQNMFIDGRLITYWFIFNFFRSIRTLYKRPHHIFTASILLRRCHSTCRKHSK